MMGLDYYVVLSEERLLEPRLCGTHGIDRLCITGLTLYQPFTSPKLFLNQNHRAYFLGGVLMRGKPQKVRGSFALVEKRLYNRYIRYIVLIVRQY